MKPAAATAALRARIAELGQVIAARDRRVRELQDDLERERQWGDRVAVAVDAYMAGHRGLAWTAAAQNLEAALKEG